MIRQRVYSPAVSSQKALEVLARTAEISPVGRSVYSMYWLVSDRDSGRAQYRGGGSRGYPAESCAAAEAACSGVAGTGQNAGAATAQS